MFAILQISQRNTILRKPEIRSERFNLPSDDAFFVVTTDKHLGKIPWKKLEKCLGILRHGIILPEDITVPDGINVTAFTPDILPRLMLINSATDYIIRHKSDFISKNLTVYDEKGIYPNHIEKLLPCFCGIKIVTHRPETYEKLSCTLMENYGFSLMVTSAQTYDSDVIISYRCRVPVYFNGRVFTNERKTLMNSKVLCGNGISLPDEYENMRPANIDRVLFASALYEKCCLKEMATLRYSDFGS